MKSIVKATLTLALLLPIAGCWSKKEETPAPAAHAEQAIAPAHQKQEAGKCSHKGCTHDHSKNHGNKKHQDNVEVQDMDMDDMDDMEIEDMDDMNDMNEMQDLE